ncbi:MAG: GHKL domain-containing protein [Chlorobi bacterium]|nr:GHKL domain-containing protein [Chlorobiota bacterium]
MSFKSRLDKIFSNLTLWHTVFWLTNLTLFTFPFFLKYNREGIFQFEKLLPGLIYTIHLAIIVYINYFVLIPHIAGKKKIWQYFLAVTFSVIIVNIMFALVFQAATKIPLSWVNALSFSVLEFVYIIITSFFKFFKDWVENRGLQLKLMDIEKQKVEAELSALKSQLNPHFLFNVLNSIYAHSILKSDITPSIVLKLSDLMSYILYDCKTNMVSLQKEVEFIRNYIELEKIRLEEDIEVNFHVININHALIPPLLFVPLIDNAFKHGISSNPEKKCISLTIEIFKNRLCFSLVNSKGSIKNGIKGKTKGGIGIQNVRKRLELLYPDNHKMKVVDSEGKFEVEIIIDKFNTKNQLNDGNQMYNN